MALSKTEYIFGEFTDNESEQLMNDGKELVEFSPPSSMSSSGKPRVGCHDDDDQNSIGPVFDFPVNKSDSPGVQFGSSPVESQATPLSNSCNDKETLKSLNVNAHEFVPNDRTGKKMDGVAYVPTQGMPPPAVPAVAAATPAFAPHHPFYYPFYPSHCFPADPRLLQQLIYAPPIPAVYHGYRFPFPASGPTPPPPPLPSQVSTAAGPQVAVVAPYRSMGADTRAPIRISDEKLRGMDYSVNGESKSHVPLSPSSLPSSPPALSTHGDSGIDMAQSKSVSPPSTHRPSSVNEIDDTVTTETASQSIDTTPPTNEDTSISSKDELYHQTTPTHQATSNETVGKLDNTLLNNHHDNESEGALLNCSTPVIKDNEANSPVQEDNEPHPPLEDNQEPHPLVQEDNEPHSPSKEDSASPNETIIQDTSDLCQTNTTESTPTVDSTPNGELTPSLSANENSMATPTPVTGDNVEKSADSKVDVKDDEEVSKTTDTKTESNEAKTTPTRTAKPTINLNTTPTVPSIKQEKTTPIDNDASKTISNSSSNVTKTTPTTVSSKTIPNDSNHKESVATPTSSKSKKSWASIVGVTNGNSTTTHSKGGAVVTTPTVASTKKVVTVVEEPRRETVVSVGTKEIHHPVVSQEDRSRLRILGGQLKNFSLSPEGHSVIPRGLRNIGNLCYIHAPLQALISCPSFYQLFLSIRLPPLPKDSHCLSTNVTDTMAHFVRQFKQYPRDLIGVYEDTKNGYKKKRQFIYEEPFWPEFIYEMLSRSKSMLSVKGRQEDAEEFLCWVLSKLHDEMVTAMQIIDTPTEDAKSEEQKEAESRDEEGEEEWQEVGPRNKSVITRRTSCEQSPISQMFGGKLQSTLHRAGVKETVTVEPFFSLPLDIQPSDIHTVRDALELMCTRESVSVASSNGKEVGVATRRLTLAELPPYLILHIKRFQFDGTTTHKITKQVEYDQDLEIPKDLIAVTSRGKISQNQRTYKLWAVIYHQGKTVDKGHYICDVYHPAASSWIRVNDNYVKTIPADFVFNPSRAPNPHAPYLLFYKQFEFANITYSRRLQ